jgi:hypothetical protein
MKARQRFGKVTPPGLSRPQAGDGDPRSGWVDRGGFAAGTRRGLLAARLVPRASRGRVVGNDDTQAKERVCRTPPIMIT